MTGPGSERGVAAVETAIVAVVVLFVVVAGLPIMQTMSEYNELDRAAATGVRFATKVDRNPSHGPCGLSRRRTENDVRAYVVQSSRSLITDPALVTVAVTPRAGSSNTTLCGALPGSSVTVSVTYRRTLGPLEDAANDLAGYFGGGPLFTTAPRTLSATGVLE